MTSARTLVIPGYQVVQYLGRGARSTIWQVRDRRTGNLLALKRVVRREPSDARFLDQAANEYEVGSRLEHPAVRRIHEIRRIRKLLTLREVHLIMEYCEGATVQEDRPTDLPETVRVFLQVAEGLAHMNARSIIHADMKPNNILVAPDGAVKIIDFGQSCPLGTIKERVQGTPDFIAPEQVHRRPLDARTDVFNFGAALYWTLTGRAIPTALPKKGALTMKADMVVQPIEQSNPDVPAALTKLVMDCVEVQPSRRPDSMNEVVSRLHLIAHKLLLDAQGGVKVEE